MGLNLTQLCSEITDGREYGKAGSNDDAIVTTRVFKYLDTRF
jgi:hypothetical protein